MARLPADLPVASVLAEAVAASRTGTAVVTAPPGSGKTMLVPAAVLDDLPAASRVILLQPRRLAARAVARQIARLRDGEVGGEVGYQVRFESRVGPATRLLVETTGIMLRRLVADVSLDGIGAVVLDEFHERSLEMDLVLGMLVRLRETLRPDLRIVVMSATLDAGPVAALLGRGGSPCPVVSAAGRMFPVDVTYLRHGDRRDLTELVASTVPEAIRRTDGHALVFLPGVGEILRCQQDLAGALERQGIVVLPLYGDLPPEQQDRVLADIGRRKVILATNVAETSLTIPGVTAVVDSGLARQSRVSHATGLPRLELVPISKAAADQRAGRAGRTAPGVCWRLWDESAHQHRAAAEPPEAVRGDLAGPLLQLLALGEAEGFPWLDPPPAESLGNARGLLLRLGAVAPGPTGRDEVTPLGHDLLRLPAHPRLARLLLAGGRHGVLRETSIAAALLSERDPFRTPKGSGPRDRRTVRSRSDVVDRVVALQAFRAGVPVHDPALEPHPGGAANVLRVAEQLSGLVDTLLVSFLGDSAVSAFNYAQTVYLLPMSILGTGEAAASLPEMAAEMGEGSRDARNARLRERLAASLERVTVLAIPAVVVLTLSGEALVAVLFRTGRFDRDSVERVAAAVAVYGLALLGNASGRLFATTFYALGDTRTPARLALVRVAVSTALALTLMGRLGMAGVGAGAVAAAWVEASLLGRSLASELDGLGLRALPWRRLVLLACATAAPALAARHLLAARESTPLLALASLATTGLVYVAAAAGLRLVDPTRLVRRLRRR